MRLFMSCMSCQIEAQGGMLLPQISVVELRDDGQYEVTCVKGHKTLTILQQNRFEILFEIGAYAIVDGYYREAVASFAASLERFYEFFIRAKFLQENLPINIVESSWDIVKAQSERQLGAFAFLYTQTFEVSPTLQHKKKIEFRNAVVHKGKIPSKEEALDFGQSVLDVVRPILVQMQSRLPEGLLHMSFYNLRQSIKGREDVPVTTMSHPTILSVTPNEQKSLIDSLENLKWWRDKWG